MIDPVRDPLSLVRAKSTASHPVLDGIKAGALFLESIWGITASFMIGFFPPLMFLLFGLGSLFSDPVDRFAPPWLFLIGLLISTPLAFWEVGLIVHLSMDLLSTQHEEAEAVGESLLARADEPSFRLPQVPRLLAPLLSLWWLAHFAGGALVCRGAEVWVKAAYGDPSELTVYLWSQGLGLAFTVAMNLYLLLAIAVFVRNPATLIRLWRWRFVVDMVVTMPASLATAWDWLP